MDYNYKTTIEDGNSTILYVFNQLNKISKYQFTVNISKDRYNCYDSSVTTCGKTFLVEHKNRNFNSLTLRERYNNTLLLEKFKYDALISKLNYSNCVDILYAVTLKDGITYIFKLKNFAGQSVEVDCPKKSCNSLDLKEKKEVYYLNIKDAIRVD